MKFDKYATNRVSTFSATFIYLIQFKISLKVSLKYACLKYFSKIFELYLRQEGYNVKHILVIFI